MRLVTVLSTKDNNKKEITTDVTTWGELKPLIDAAGIATGNMKAMVRSTKATLEHTSALLPTEAFTIFLTPGKVKSGK